MNSSPAIIVGIDYSPSSPNVLRQAMHLSKQTGLKVVALNVIDSGALSAFQAVSSSKLGKDEITSMARAKLEAWLEEAGGPAEVEIRVGRPVDEIHGCIEDHKASLLVIAANDTTKKRMGTIASRCVRAAPCDVMVVRGSQSGDFHKIAVCADFSETSALALERAVRLAVAQGAALEVVHVMYPPDSDLWGKALDSDEDTSEGYAKECRAIVEKEMKEFLAPHVEALSGIDHQTVVLESTVPSVTLTHHVMDCGADLVVLGTRGHSKFASHFLGTNAERLMQESAVSVLAIRP